MVVDNTDVKGRPVIIEHHPTSINLFGSIDSIANSNDFTIKVGSLVKLIYTYYFISDFLNTLQKN